MMLEKDLENIDGKMVEYIEVILRMMLKKEMENIYGKMVEYIKVILKIILNVPYILIFSFGL